MANGRWVSVTVPGPDGTLVERTREAGMALWGLFGTTNQLLAGLTLLLATRYLARRGRWAVVTAVPMFLMLASTLVAMVRNILSFRAGGELPLLVVGSVLFVLTIWLCVEGVLAVRRDRRVRT